MEVLETDKFDGFDKIYSQHFFDQFPLPEAKHVTTLRNVVDKDKVVASGFVKLFTEAIIVTDLSLPKITRIKAIDILVPELLTWARDHKVEQVCAFTSSGFSRVLIGRYGFEHAKGIALVKNIA